jgi:hypothetical protein
LIEKDGGDITLRSDQGEGVMFSVWLLLEPDLMEKDSALMEPFQSTEQSLGTAGGEQDRHRV